MKGRDRVVVLVPWFKIVVKFPIIHLLQFLESLFTDLTCVRRWGRLGERVLWPIEVREGLKGQLFGGLAANWNEFLFYSKTNNPFLQPTYFSFFGLLNVQLLGEKCSLDESMFWNQLYELTDGRVRDDMHHFSNPDNFCRPRT